MNNKRGYDQKIAGQVNRLAVFRFIKTVMETDGICPTGHEVAKVVGISAQAANGHMKALANADGLPFPIPTGTMRAAESNTGIARQETVTMLSMFRRTGSSDGYGPIPLDRLLQD